MFFEKYDTSDAYGTSIKLLSKGTSFYSLETADFLRAYSSNIEKDIKMLNQLIGQKNRACE